jgi:hypothetical protein
MACRGSGELPDEVAAVSPASGAEPTGPAHFPSLLENFSPGVCTGRSSAIETGGDRRVLDLEGIDPI